MLHPAYPPPPRFQCNANTPSLSQASHLFQVMHGCFQELLPIAHPALALAQVHVEANLVHPRRHSVAIPPWERHIRVHAATHRQTHDFQSAKHEAFIARNCYWVSSYFLFYFLLCCYRSLCTTHSLCWTMPVAGGISRPCRLTDVFALTAIHKTKTRHCHTSIPPWVLSTFLHKTNCRKPKLFCVSLLYHQMKIGRKKGSTAQKASYKQSSFHCLYEPSQRLWPWRWQTNLSAQRSSSWWCRGVLSLVTKGSEVQKI